MLTQTNLNVRLKMIAKMNVPRDKKNFFNQIWEQIKKERFQKCPHCKAMNGSIRLLKKSYRISHSIYKV